GSTYTQILTLSLHAVLPTCRLRVGLPPRLLAPFANREGARTPARPIVRFGHRSLFRSDAPWRIRLEERPRKRLHGSRYSAASPRSVDRRVGLQLRPRRKMVS